MNKSFDRYSSLLFACIGMGFMVESRRISDSGFGSNMGPDIFPFGLGLILLLLSLGLFYETFKYRNEKQNKQTLDYKRFSIILIAGVLYGFFLEEIGYIIGTFIFLLIGFQTMQRGKWVFSILISGAFSVGVYFIFVTLLHGTLPGFPTF